MANYENELDRDMFEEAAEAAEAAVDEGIGGLTTGQKILRASLIGGGALLLVAGVTYVTKKVIAPKIKEAVISKAERNGEIKRLAQPAVESTGEFVEECKSEEE